MTGLRGGTTLRSAIRRCFEPPVAVRVSGRRFSGLRFLRRPVARMRAIVKRKARAGWTLYDDSGGVCRRWISFWEGDVHRSDFHLAPLQAEWVRAKFRLNEPYLLHDPCLLLLDEPGLWNGCLSVSDAANLVGLAGPTFFKCPRTEEFF